MLSVNPMSAGDARTIVGWRYPPPYDLYDLDSDTIEEDVEWFSDPANRYFSVQDGDELVAYICFGEEARVPGGDYDDAALDVGCGTRPDLTGQGMGPSIIETAVAFGRKRFGAYHFRSTIAAFNERALKAAQRAGFVPIGRFERPSDSRPFVVLERADSPDSSAR